MSRLTVYRIEHLLSGQGPFGGDNSQEMRDKLSTHCAGASSQLPEAHLDCPGFEGGYHYCAVRTLSNVNEWFGPFRDELRAGGFVLMEYEPLSVNVRDSTSGLQVFFPKYDATPRRQVPWPG